MEITVTWVQIIICIATVIIICKISYNRGRAAETLAWMEALAEENEERRKL